MQQCRQFKIKDTDCLHINSVVWPTAPTQLHKTRNSNTPLFGPPVFSTSLFSIRIDHRVHQYAWQPERRTDTTLSGANIRPFFFPSKRAFWGTLHQPTHTSHQDSLRVSHRTSVQTDSMYLVRVQNDRIESRYLRV